MKLKSKICFIIYSLSRGGAEKVFSTIANNLDSNKYEIYFITIRNRDNSWFELSEKINYIPIGNQRTIMSVLSLVKILREIKPRIIYSTIGQVNIIVGAIAGIRRFIGLTNTRFYMRETSIPSINNLNSKIPASILYFLIKYFYPFFDNIIVQGKEMRNDLVSNFGIPNKLILEVRNPILIEDNLEVSRLKNITPNFITVGNLTNIKGYDRLIKILASLKLRLKFNYIIVGEGYLRQNIQNLINVNGLTECCKLIGRRDNVADFLKDSDIFLQGSYYEGFPNVLLESCICGVPIVAFDVKGGTSEIVQNGVNGYLVEDGDLALFEQKIIDCINSKFDKKKMISTIVMNHSVEVIIKKYDELFEQRL